MTEVETNAAAEAIFASRSLANSRSSKGRPEDWPHGIRKLKRYLTTGEYANCPVVKGKASERTDFAPGEPATGDGHGVRRIDLHV